MAQVKIDNITKEYGDVTAVNKMNFTVEDGEFVTLVGPSGCGKSTTLSSIAGLTFPTNGSIHIGNQDVTNYPPKDRGIAMVFQNIALFPHMNVYDNISFGLRLRNYNEDEIDKKVKDGAKTVQINGMLDRMPDELSGGQRQRVAIARAIVRNPGVFLMDEPLANLDAKLRTHMRTEIQRLHKELGTTTIYVTHDQEEAMTMSDRIAIINNGELQQIAPPLTCYNEPKNKFVASFIGSPSMNFFSGEISGENMKFGNSNFKLDPKRTSVNKRGKVTFGIRPENIYLADNSDEITLPSPEIKITTDVLQPMGDGIYVYFFFSEDTPNLVGLDLSDQYLMSVGPGTKIEEDEQKEVIFDQEKIHLFDPSTGETIQHGLVQPTEEGTEVEAEN